MAIKLVYTLTFLLLIFHCCHVSRGSLCQHSCGSILKQDSLKCRIICGDETHKPERIARSIRSTSRTLTTTTEFSTEQPKNKYDCNHLYPQVYDKHYGISNPVVTNVTIQYSRWKNKTRAWIKWDMCLECLKKDICRGYFLQWNFPNEDWRCLKINDINRRNFILNDTTGFDGIKSYGISVIAFPSAMIEIETTFIKPPSPDSITDDIISLHHLTSIPKEKPSKKENHNKTRPIINHSKEDCNHLYPQVYDKHYGISNPVVTNVTIQYSRWKNKTRAWIKWDMCLECLKKDICRGYFLQWNFPYEDWRCLKIDDINRRNFILNDTTGFDGIKPFGISVIAFPSAMTEIEVTFIKPPSPDSITDDIISLDHLTNIPKQKPSKKENHNKTRPVVNHSKEGDEDHDERTTLKVAVGLFTTFILCIAFVFVYWFYRKHQQIKYNIPIHRPSYWRLITGAHYISYLPETSTTTQVFNMYSWLTSHHIDVIMDKMHDPKLYNSLGPKRFGEKFAAKAEKVIMIVSPGYLELCWLDDTVDMNSKTILNSLDKERLYSEVAYIKNELSTTINHAQSRFIPVLLNVQEDDLPKWLNKLTTVYWPKDGKTDRFLAILKGEIH